MRTSGRLAAFGLLAASVALFGSGAARAATVFVDDNITAPVTTWTADNEYILTGVRFVKPGATLRIEPGTVIRSEGPDSICAQSGNACATSANCNVGRSEPCVNDLGTLVIPRGARIEAAGTALKPIIFTNLDDDNLFANSEPDPDGDYVDLVVARAKTGTWGGVIILGRGYVANTTTGGPDPAREVLIEGLQNRGYCTISDERCLDDTDCTGGLDTCDLSLGFYGDCAATALNPSECDEDDSGFFHYVSIRYGGFELSSANEINGLTLGGVGRNTSIHHVEVLQNRDDGIECFGGAVNLKYIVVNGVGDDGLDYDEGWRGNVQFFFQVQGRPGSETSDKGGEHDGGVQNASKPEAIPDIWNATYIGLGGNGAGAAGTNLFDPVKLYAKRPTNTTLHIRDAAGGGYKNSAFLDWGGALALVEGDCGSVGSSGGHVTTPYVAPSGNCSNDTTIDCTSDAPCLGGGGVCVLHYLPQPGRANKLEFEDNHFWCYGNPDPDGDTIPSFPRSATDATGAGGDGGLHCDPGFFPVLNQYTTCADPLPIRELVRTPDIASPTVADPIESIDPRPAPGSPLLAVSQLPPDNGFFTQAPCKGAFCDDINWAAGWTATYVLGYFPTPRECSNRGNPCMDDLQCAIGETCDPVNVVMVDTNIEGDVLWTKDNEYVLTGVRFVKPGSTLTVDPGTVIRSEPSERICSVSATSCVTNADCDTGRGEPCLNDPGTLVVARGARLIAEGTAEEPIVFTNIFDDNVGVSLGRASGDYGDRDAARAISATWGGVVLLGRGYVANNSVAGPNPAREVRIEGLQDRGFCTVSDARCLDDTDCGGGLDTCDLGLAFYGDCADTALSPAECDDDDSGSLKYVSIRYGGFELGSANEINGLTLGGTGRSTELDSIEIYQNKDDCYEAFGGSALVKRIICLGVGDDGLDYDEGYRGSVQFFVNIQHFTAGEISDKGGEHDGGIPNTSLPEAQPAIYNATFIGLGGNGAPQDPFRNYAAKPTNTTLHIRDNAATAYYNSFFGNFGGALGLIEGACGADGTSGGHVDTPYVAPRGNCSNDTTIGCTDDGPCTGGGGVCVFHYLPRHNQTFETEFESDTWWCFGNPFGDNDGQVKFPTDATLATAAGGDGGAHCDPGIFTNVSLLNEYIICGAQEPIRQLQRGTNPDPNLPNQIELLDIRPRIGGPLFEDVRATPNDGFFEPAPFRGAVGNDNWLTGWTNMSRLGYFGFCSGGAGPAPDETTGLEVSRVPSNATISWDPSALPGLMGIQYYDTLRFLRPDAATAVDFTAAGGIADCLESDDEDTVTVDTVTPPLGQAYIYRSRTVSDCGDAPLGVASDNTVVPAKACP